MEASRSVHRSTLGDAAFDQLVRTHRPSLERHVRGLGASREDFLPPGDKKKAALNPAP